MLVPVSGARRHVCASCPGVCASVYFTTRYCQPVTQGAHSKDPMGLEARRKDEERREEEVSEEAKTFAMQEVAGGFSSLEEAALALEALDPNADGARRFQQPFSAQPSTTESSTMRKIELPPRCHWAIFLGVDRLVSSKEPDPVPSTSSMSDTAARPRLLLPTTPRLCHLPPPLPAPVSGSSCPLTGCQPLCACHCSGLLTVLFKVLGCKI